MLKSTTVSLRPVAPSHKEWTPHGYQKRAVDFLVAQQGAAALFLDPGLGKTSITLSAFAELKARGEAKRMLVIAPLRVCQLVWRQEAQRWTQFRDLKFAFLHGPRKNDILRAGLQDGTDIFLLNPEGVPWLSDLYFGKFLPFDIVTIDELTKFKNAQATRHKRLRPRIKKITRRWGLTGTPIPNGYMDLFGQFLMLDDGQRLGKFITQYRDLYFQPAFNGFDYNLRNNGAERIEERIKPVTLRMSAEDYLTLPPLVDDIRLLEMSPKARKVYEQMKKETIAELPEGTITAANAGAVYSKLKQMANGAVYKVGLGEERTVIHLHDDKLDALENLVDELAGVPLIVGYEFNHDLQRIKERFGKDIPYIGSGVSSARAEEIERKWNAGEISLLPMHPASAAHGLNFQHGGAAHIVWFSASWDLELYDQLIRRIYRQGTTAPRVVNHLLIMKETIDELQLQALKDKDITQDRLLTALNATVLDYAPESTTINQTETVMLKKLSRRTEAAHATEDEAPRKPRGWGRAPAVDDADDDDIEDDAEVAEAPKKLTRRVARAAEDDADEAPKKPRGWGSAVAEPDDEEQDQRSKVAARLRGKGRAAEDVEEEEEAPVATKARSAFSEGVRKRLAAASGDEDGEPFEGGAPVQETVAEKPKRVRKAADEKEDVVAEADKPQRDDSAGVTYAHMTFNVNIPLSRMGELSAFIASLSK